MSAGVRLSVGRAGLAFVGLVAWAQSGCEPVEVDPCTQGCGACEATVIRVVDGDTVALDDGRKIRYIGVDTPEITKGKDECFGDEAAAYNADRVLNKRITLEYDVECEDRFHRTLAYVYVGGSMVNLDLVERGYGEALIIAPATAHEDEFYAAELLAQQLNKGVWACP